MTLNARLILKCALRMARLMYVRCGFRIRPYALVQPEGAKGEWAGEPSPLPPCGQLTRCFSAVAELLVNINSLTDKVASDIAYKFQKFRETFTSFFLGNYGAQYQPVGPLVCRKFICVCAKKSFTRGPAPNGWLLSSDLRIILTLKTALRRTCDVLSSLSIYCVPVT